MLNLKNVDIIKKDGTKEAYQGEKIIVAVSKSAERKLTVLTPEEKHNILAIIEARILHDNCSIIPVKTIHAYVEDALEQVNPIVAKSYKDYRNYKTSFIHILDEVFKKSQAIRYIGDTENANTDSALVATKRSLIFNQLNKELYKKFFLTSQELTACKDGYIYTHDMSARLDTFNCCLFDVQAVFENGFEMGNIWYNEPKSLDTAFDVLGDVILSAASQQYGGFTVPELDKIMTKYAVYSYNTYLAEYNAIMEKEGLTANPQKAHDFAMCKVQREATQGYQGIEYKLNTVGSSRGDYPFVTVSFGLSEDIFGKLLSKTFLEVHQEGQGKKGFKRPVLFPKLVFLYDKSIHSEGRICEDVCDAALACSTKTMYPDWLSLSGEGYISSMYQKYKRVVSPMGCRAFLSPWYERGGETPADENDKPVFVGRFNMGAISLHLPMILAKARQENRDFYAVLDEYMEIARNLHIRTRDYLGELRASVNPLAFCEGGIYGGHLQPNEKIGSLLKPMTAAFGITALNELQQLYNHTSLKEDGQFALETMHYINSKKAEFQKEDGILYAVYGTPAENLCGLQVTQFRKKYGIIKNVSDREYVSNSFHCHVTEQISPIQKQDLEGRFWELFNGGKIQYCRYNLGYNTLAIKTLVERAMEKGFYEGINLALSYCEDCGFEQIEMESCPKCGSTNITKIDRMNGYLGYTRVKGKSRYADHKCQEISERVSM